MAKLNGVVVTGEMVPTDSADTYAVADIKYIRGGYKIVQTYEDLEAIPEDRRTPYMKGYVIGNDVVGDTGEVTPDPKKGEYRLVPDQGWVKEITDSSDMVSNTEFNIYKTEQQEADAILNTTIEEIQKKLEEGGGLGGDGGGSFEENSIALATVGGLTSGTDISGWTAIEVLRKIFFPYQSPAFTTFTTNIKTTYELGESTPNKLTLTWNTNNQANIKPDTINCTVDGTKVNQTPLPVSGTQEFDISVMKSDTQGNKTIRISLTNTENKSATKDITLSWVNSYYVGNLAKDSISEADLASLTRKQGNSLPSSHAFAAGGYKYIIFPTTWGEYNTIKDASNGLNIALTKLNTMNISNDNGIQQSYYVYRTTNSIGGALTMTIAK